MYKAILILLTAIILCNCSQAQTSSASKKVTALELANQLKKETNIQLLDVRTPAEYKAGHVADAVNANINSEDFRNLMAALDKTKPTYIYCLSGGRSGKAAEQLRNAGFEKVVEMPGGMMEWRANNLPETRDLNLLKSKGLTLVQYQELLKSDKLVLIDFYADWCVPCQQMKPFLNQIGKDMADKVTIVRIDADANTELCKALKVNALPILKLYKNEKLIWNNLGFIEEAALRKKLK